MSIRQEQLMSTEALVRTPMSFEDYLALPEGDRAEYVDGMCIRMSASPMAGHQRVARRLANLIEDAAPSLFVVEAVGLWTGERRSRIPDVLAVEHPFDTAWADQVPQLVAEILSPSTRGEDTLRKSTEYLAAGIAHYWLVDRDGRTFTALMNGDDGWEIVLELDADHPTGEVAIGEHGTVGIDLAALLAL